MNQLKNLIIDFGGVLIDLTPERSFAAFQELGLSQITELLNPYAQQGLFLDLEEGRITAAQFRDQLRTLSGINHTDQMIDAAWNSFLDTIPTYKLDLLLKLKTQYNVLLLSNCNEIHWKYASENCFAYNGYKVDDYFHKQYISFQVGIAKPNPEIFKHLLEDAHIVAQETLFIDDSVANCEMAQTFGINTYTPKPAEDWSHLFNQAANR